MIAIYKKELRLFFAGLSGYAVTAIMLLISGIYISSICLSGQYLSGLEYPLSGAVWMLAVIIPMLTMRSFVEETRQHTDKLLYSSPVTAAQVVLGKFLANLTVFMLPLAVMSIYPLIFSAFGKVDFASAYLAVLAIALCGSVLIAFGILISSLTESYIVAALASLCSSLLMFFMPAVSSAAIASAGVAFVVLTVLVVALVALIYSVTKSSALAVAVGSAAELCVVLLTVLSKSTVTAILSDILSWLGVFNLTGNLFVGIVDIAAIVYYVSLTALMLFFTVQSLEKKRWA